MKKQHENVLKAIIDYVEKHGYPPTVREIGEATGLKSTSSVHRYLKEMFELGILETDAEFSNPRAIRIPGYVFVKEEALERIVERLEELADIFNMEKQYSTYCKTIDHDKCEVADMDCCSCVLNKAIEIVKEEGDHHG